MKYAKKDDEEITRDLAPLRRRRLSPPSRHMATTSHLALVRAAAEGPEVYQATMREELMKVSQYLIDLASTDETKKLRAELRVLRAENKRLRDARREGGR